jgi:hypothetical protein
MMRMSYMPLESSVRLSEAISGITMINDITLMLKCLRKLFRRVLENGSKNGC